MDFSFLGALQLLGTFCPRNFLPKGFFCPRDFVPMKGIFSQKTKGLFRFQGFFDILGTFFLGDFGFRALKAPRAFLSLYTSSRDFFVEIKTSTFFQEFSTTRRKSYFYNQGTICTNSDFQSNFLHQSITQKIQCSLNRNIC